MELKRKPFQGVLNIVRFNWHFYLIAGLVITSSFFLTHYLPEQTKPFAFTFTILAFLAIIISLLTSYYIYDYSPLYQINWLSNLNNKKILNINAGFDETSGIIKNKFPECELTICDFYNPEKHTEISIKRARRAYPMLEKTIQVTNNNLPFQNSSFDSVLAILSAHEIRDENERIHFFIELNRVIKPTGQIFVTEHLRDWNNFIVYTIGFFHFHSRASWLKTFKGTNLIVKKQIKTTPFITTFILEKNVAAL
ncbi:MAG: class I SAM-dependent methyltransferase [Bacteroidota bacterium]